MGRESPMPESSGSKLTAYVFLSVWKIGMYSRLAANFPFLDDYSEAMAGLFHNLFVEQLFF